MKSTQEKAVAPAKPYTPTPDEKAAVEAYRQRKNKTPRVKAIEKDGYFQLMLDHPSPLHAQMVLMQALGVHEVDFIGELLMQLGRACANTKAINQDRLNFMVAVIKGIAPKDQLETMLAAQMGAIHMLTMEFATRLANAGDLVWRDSAERTLNKLARTFAVQLEALKRYRTGGEQKVIVHHVSVSDGGQAIVGNVSNRAVGATEKRESTS